MKTKWIVSIWVVGLVVLVGAGVYVVKRDQQMELARIAAMTPEERAAERKEAQRQWEADQAASGRPRPGVLYDGPQLPAPAPSAITTGEATGAYVMAKEFVAARLAAPSTATFGSFRESTVSRVDDGSYVVQGYVDAQNAHGAMLRTHYTVRLRDKGNDKWLLIAIE